MHVASFVTTSLLAISLLLAGCSSTDPDPGPNPLIVAWDRHVATTTISTGYADTLGIGVTEWVVSSPCEEGISTGIPFRFGKNASSDALTDRTFRYMIKFEEESSEDLLFMNYIGYYSLRADGPNVFIGISFTPNYGGVLLAPCNHDGSQRLPETRLLLVDSTRIVTELWTAQRVRKP